MEDLPPDAVLFESRSEWRKWLERNAASNSGIWVVTNKKNSGLPRLEYEEIVQEALCFGWIDSKPRKLDEVRSMLWCAPRKAGSGWSKKNKLRAERLISEGLMADIGLQKIEQSKADGSWFALDDVENLVIDTDLATEFSRYNRAASYFAAFPRFTQRAILEWISQAKKPETRAKRIEETARLAANNERANQWRKSG